MSHLILASTSPTRKLLLQNAGVPFESLAVRIDEEAIRQSLVADGSSARDIADALAEFKACKGSEKSPERLVLGSDQILALKGKILSKAEDVTQAKAQLQQLSGQTHHLYAAAVIYEDGKPVWRAVGAARLSMHTLTEPQIDAYLEQAWPTVSGSVGGYQAENIGAQLFSRIDGDWFSVLGLPLLQVLSYLRLRGMLAP